MGGEAGMGEGGCIALMSEEGAWMGRKRISLVMAGR